jgi:hypothetical protein
MVETIRSTLIITMLLFLVGCTAFFYTPQDLMSDNRAHLSSLHPGLTKDEAIKIMGTEGKSKCNKIFIFAICISSEIINNPYRTTGFQSEGKAYDILYYWTDVKQKDDVITDDELTPLIFENGKLIGWGRDLLDATIKKYEFRVR